MDRSEKIGLGVAIAGHVVLFGLLSVGFLATPNPLKLKATPMEVTLSDQVAMEAEAPQATEQPAASVAPEQGKPEDAAPAEPAPAEPVKAPPEPAPPKPAPAPEKPKPAPPRPEPKPQPQPKPAEAAKPRPEPKPKPEPAPARSAAKEKPAPAKPAPAKEVAKAAPAKSQAGSARSEGKTADAKAAHARGSRLGPDFLKGIADTPSKSDNPTPRAAKVGQRDMASIAGIIARQVHPCYDLGSLAGTSAMDIVTMLRLQFRSDGSVIAATVVDQAGIDDDNRGYARQMGELSRRAVLRCAPLKGLPPELYEGGWSDFRMRFTPRQLG